MVDTITTDQNELLEKILMQECQRCQDIDSQNEIIELASSLGMKALVTKMHIYCITAPSSCRPLQPILSQK